MLILATGEAAWRCGAGGRDCAPHCRSSHPEWVCRHAFEGLVAKVSRIQDGDGEAMPFSYDYNISIKNNYAYDSSTAAATTKTTLLYYTTVLTVLMNVGCVCLYMHDCTTFFNSDLQALKPTYMRSSDTNKTQVAN